MTAFMSGGSRGSSLSLAPRRCPWLVRRRSLVLAHLRLSAPAEAEGRKDPNVCDLRHGSRCGLCDHAEEVWREGGTSYKRMQMKTRFIQVVGRSWKTSRKRIITNKGNKADHCLNVLVQFILGTFPIDGINLLFSEQKAFLIWGFKTWFTRAITFRLLHKRHPCSVATFFRAESAWQGEKSPRRSLFQ